GILTKSRRQLLTAYIGNVAFGNVEEGYRYYARLSVPSGRTNLEAFKRETRSVLQKWYDASTEGGYSLQERHVGQVVGGIMSVLQKNAVRLDLDTLLFWRAAIALDSSALSLSSDFDLINEMRLYFAQQSTPFGEQLGKAGERVANLIEISDAVTAIQVETVEEMAAERFLLSVSAAEGETTGRRDGTRATRALLFSLLLASTLPVLASIDASSFRDWLIAVMVVGAVLSLRLLKT